ncbi:P-loop containing nucleoside triphosphate hydrolase protein [Lasiosphaeris hirsuta]|uniref:P-loop containing nucleoside triphosphate hydrolase protein n=1 Tax=Lasiosphaeris hirsuta TaxID=260670 RepID=A0AA40AFV5_9PEZI|nr:P-loop containing nucleoside triphosphate hydrolase protein [Lasiosphaeris hirsuta]
MDGLGQDGLFGPQLPGSFDFTLAFEHSIFSIIPSALFLVACVARIQILLRKRSRVVIFRHGNLYWSKTALVILLSSLQIALLVQWSLQVTTPTNRALAIAASVLSVAAALTLGVLTDLNQRTAVEPSLLAGGYLFLSVLLDLPQARSLWRRQGLVPLAAVFIVSIATKGALLLLEELPKLPADNPLRKEAGPESNSGVINRSVFWWLNAFLLRGYRNLIGLGDLSTIPSKFDSQRLLNQIEPHWEKSSREKKYALLFTTFRSFAFQTLLAVPPRLAKSVFLFTQPFLMNRVIEYVANTSFSPEEQSLDVARGLIGATVLVYVGIAISNCAYNHVNYQLITMVRGALVTLIFKKTLSLEATTLTDAAPLTLMSTDIESLTIAFRFFHDIWAGLVELGVGMFLLYRETGAPCFLVVVPILLATFLTERFSGKMIPAQIAWNQAIQKRVSSSSKMLAQMKGIKIMGLASYFSTYIQDLRQGEIELSKKMRLLMVLLEALSDWVSRFTPIIIITATVFWTNAGRDLPIAKAFTTVAIVTLVSEPLAILVSVRSHFGSALGSFIRIQAFLLLNERKEYRHFVRTHFPGHDESEKSAEVSHGTSQGTSSCLAVDIRQATFRAYDDTVLLTEIDLQVKEGSCHVISGSVGCGKSSLLRAIMGELLLDKGTVDLTEDSIAYCAQAPWLRNASIRENVLGGSEFGYDAAWYSRVMHACALDKDFTAIPDWDQHTIGSGALTLSGGQKSRLALARAVYSRKKLTILDDVFSGLDHKTAGFVFDQLLGDRGILRQPGQTVILTTNLAHFLPRADAVSTLESGILRTVENAAALSMSEGQDILTSEALSVSSSTPHGAASTQQGQFQSAITKADDLPSNENRKGGDSTLYLYYLRSVGLVIAGIFLAGSTTLAGLNRMPQVWLRIWTEHGTSNDTALYFGIYIVFGVAGIVCAGFTLGYYFLVFMPSSAKNLHHRILETVLRAPLYFFTKVDSGITINRFSQDLSLVDQQLPMAFLGAAFLTFDVAAATGIIVSGASYTAVIIPFTAAVLYILQRFYLRTSRQMRFLDLEAKSPLYSHFTESLGGMVTVRAFGWEGVFLDEHRRRLDISQKPYYLLFCLQRWLGLVLDLLVAGMAVALVAFALLFHGASSGGAVGLSMLNLIGFSQSLAGLVLVWTQLETSLGAISRVRDFVQDTPKEDLEGETQMVPDGWPTKGEIKFQNVAASYRQVILSSLGSMKHPPSNLPLPSSAELEPALRGVTLEITPASKVAICGRTGSGKSSTLLTILRLLDLNAGTILIDGVDLSCLPRETIRAHLASLPQDPVALPGSVRANLAPFCTSPASSPTSAPHNPTTTSASPDVSDHDLIAALTSAHIWPIIEARGGLDADFDSLNLSPGQRQLFCLAGAAVRRCHVVLLDEVTGSVDFETDAEVRRMLMHEFSGCTVLEVVHRVEMVMGYDVVVVMDGGVVVEVGKPDELLGKEGGRFKALWEGRGGQGE